MQSVQPIFSNGTAYAIKELNLGQVIEIAKIPQKQNERKISAILTAIIGDIADPYELSLQERHYLMMKYVERHNETFGYNIDFKDFEKDGMAQETVEVNGYQFRHLNGYECEALEQYAKSYLDWVMGSIALQISGNGIAAMLPAKDINFAINVIQSRIDDLYALDLATSELIFNSYFEAMPLLNDLLDYTFDDEGVLVVGGMSEKLVRFCEISTVPATVEYLIESLSTKDANIE